MKYYNTGKVKIGVAYTGPIRSYMNEGNIFWQRVLLGDQRSWLQKVRDYLEGHHG